MKKSVLIIIGFFILLFLVLGIFSAKITGNVVFEDFPTSFSGLAQNEMVNFAVVFIFAFIAFYLLIYKTIFRNSKGLAIITGLLIAALASFGILNAFGPVLSYLSTPIGTAIIIIALVLAVFGIIRWNTRNRAPVMKAIIFAYPIGYIIYSVLTSDSVKASLGFLHKILTFLFYPMFLIAIFTLLVTLFKRRKERVGGRVPTRGSSRRDRKQQKEEAKRESSYGEKLEKIRLQEYMAHQKQMAEARKNRELSSASRLIDKRRRSIQTYKNKIRRLREWYDRGKNNWTASEWGRNRRKINKRIKSYNKIINAHERGIERLNKKFK